MTQYDLFISYRRLDAPRVRPLVERLRGLGLGVWIDEAEIEDFAGVTRTIMEGLAQSKAVLAWYSAIYPLSRPCQWEITAAYLAAQQGGDPRQRVLIVNPETSPDHIALPELKDQQYLSAPAMDDQGGYHDLATRIAAQVQGLEGTLGDIRPLVTPSWFPNTPTGSARFVGRLRHMWQIHNALWRGQTVIGQLKQGAALAQLVGGGGMGKSLLAEEYALRYGAAYPGGVFWLSARTVSESGAAIMAAVAQQREQQWRNLAAWLGMEIKDKTVVQIEGELHAHFARKNQPFLWVIDDVPPDVPVVELGRWFAPHPLGKTLLTTRSHEYEALGGKVEVGVLEPDEARSLLTQQRPPADAAEAAAVKGILTALGRHALAVDVAAARLKGKPYPEFLADLNNLDADALELAKHFAGQLPNGHEASIATTLLQGVDAANEETRDFLRLAAVLAVKAIPRRLVAAVFAGADGLSDSAARDRADLALHEAQEQSLAEASGDADFSVTVHVLVTRTVRFRAAHPERSTALRNAAVQALTAELAAQADDIRNHAALTNGIEHARHLATVDEYGAAYLLPYIAIYDSRRGAYVAARESEEKVLVLYQRILGENAPVTLKSKNNLAVTLLALGEYAAAHDLLSRALEVQRRTLGEDHPDTLTSMNNLASTLFAQGEYAAARDLQERVLALRRQVLGEDHPDTLTTIYNLAGTLLAQGEYAAARDLQERVLALQRRVLGEDHPGALANMINLAVTLRTLGELAAARDLQERVLAVQRRMLGEDHPVTLTGKNNLALTLRDQREYAAARELQEQVLAGRRRQLGDEHPDTLMSMDNLALVMRDQHEFIAARDLQEQVAATYRKVLGEDHPDTLKSMSNLSETMFAQGELSAARELQERVLSSRQRRLGAHHSDTTVAAWNLLQTLVQGDLHDQAVLLIKAHLAWLFEANPETLSADQRHIRNQLGHSISRGANETPSSSKSKTDSTTQPRRKP